VAEVHGGQLESLALPGQGTRLRIRVPGGQAASHYRPPLI